MVSRVNDLESPARVERGPGEVARGTPRLAAVVEVRRLRRLPLAQELDAR